MHIADIMLNSGRMSFFFVKTNFEFYDDVLLYGTEGPPSYLASLGKQSRPYRTLRSPQFLFSF